MNYTLDTVPDDFIKNIFSLNECRQNDFVIFFIIGCIFYSLLLLLIDLDAIIQNRNYKFAFNFFMFICSVIAIKIMIS
jgi:hypothetical protein